MPPAARRETPVGEHRGAGSRTPASASYEEHDYDNRGVPYRYERYDHKHASKLKPGSYEAAVDEETFEPNFSEAPRIAIESQSQTREDPSHTTGHTAEAKGRCSQAETSTPITLPIRGSSETKNHQRQSRRQNRQEGTAGD